ncbi:MAG: protein-glutamate O-methyltransferase CheR [Chloroflexi bacterium]|nr:protein-glutamate O-methyltransferase CheR [Chloroflexota bacterium]
MEDREYVQLQRKVLALTGIDLQSYKSKQMRRRLDSLLRRSKFESWASYIRELERNEDTLQHFKDFITINVSSFFRDPQKFAYLQDKILPELLRTRQHLAVWSAGSSHGGEPYTLAMILTEMTPHRPHRILGTDIDRLNLEKSKVGGPYGDDDVKTIPNALRRKYLVSRNGDGHYVAESLRRMVRFRYFNLLKDTMHNKFDLIVCRNVVIYFTDETKDKLYRSFYDALTPGGVLFVGGTEIVTKAQAIGFKSAGISFYRKESGSRE